MANEYRLSYTAQEINARLGKIDDLVDIENIPTKTSDLTNDSGFITETYVQDYAQPKGDYALNSDITVKSVNGQTGDVNLSAHDVGALPNTTIIPTKVSELANDSGFITDYIETDPTVPDWAKEPIKPSYTAEEVGALPDTTVIPTVPTNVSAFVNDAGYLTEHQSLDGLATEGYVDEKISEIHIPDTSAQINAHNTATDAHNDIRNLISAIVVPTKVSELANDKNYLSAVPSEYITETELAAKGYLTEHQSLSDYAKTNDLGNLAFKDSLTASDVGADVSGTASSAVSSHNTNTSAHNDIRDLISGLTTRLNTLADSDDTTLDQMSEIVAYIKSNKTLIEDITTNKVNVSDIVNNLTTNVSNKPLSAAQGVALKALIDALDTDKLDASELTSAINTALAQAKASGEFDGADGAAGANGKDGISATHSWSGTTLTITSASGTSSADLKGSKGDTGVGISNVKQTTTSTADDGNNVITVTLTNGTTSTFTVQNGSKGSTGVDGKTPVRGTDYWTDADKAEIKSYVDDAILGGVW